MLNGTRLDFDEESKALYDAVAPTHTEAEFGQVLAELERRLPGTGPLQQRYEMFRSRFVIAPDRLDAVFKAAIDACRTRTLEQSICKYAVASGEPLIVDDTSVHPLLADSPVVHDGSVRSYAGIPLTDRHGQVVGTLCAWDGQPRHWTGSQIQILEDLSTVIQAKIFAE
jgi:GAF domain-containing protein